MYTILSVKDLTAKIKGVMEGSFPYVWVKGQVSNLSRPSSGHLYFTLKDEDASLATVWFKGSQLGAEKFDPLTGEVYEDGPRAGLAASLENGQEIVGAGRLTVYPSRGVYQLVLDLVQGSGHGKLHEEYERLKAKLNEQGYFAYERKRPLPRNPLRVALITSPGGAAVQDFIRVAEGRGLGSEIRIYPVPVQGVEAPRKIVEALNSTNKSGWAELAVLLRGGGSLEDLWAFNDEALARAIFESKLPVLAGIGHEVDFTLADLTADLRAATPSHAAQLLWSEQREIMQKTDELELDLSSNLEQFLQRIEHNLQNFAKGVQWGSPVRTLERWAESLQHVAKRMEMFWQYGLEKKSTNLSELEASLKRFPERTLTRLEKDSMEFSAISNRFERAGTDMLNNPEHSLDMLAARLEALNPMGPLERGYALVQKADGAFLRSRGEVKSKDALNIVLLDGELPVTVD